MGPLVPQTAASFGAAAGVAAWVGLADTAYRQAVEAAVEVCTMAAGALLLAR